MAHNQYEDGDMRGNNNNVEELDSKTIQIQNKRFYEHFENMDKKRFDIFLS